MLKQRRRSNAAPRRLEMIILLDSFTWNGVARSSQSDDLMSRAVTSASEENVWYDRHVCLESLSAGFLALIQELLPVQDETLESVEGSLALLQAKLLWRDVSVEVETALMRIDSPLRENDTVGDASCQLLFSASARMRKTMEFNAITICCNDVAFSASPCKFLPATIASCSANKSKTLSWLSLIRKTSGCKAIGEAAGMGMYILIRSLPQAT